MYNSMYSFESFSLNRVLHNTGCGNDFHLNYLCYFQKSEKTLFTEVVKYSGNHNIADVQTISMICNTRLFDVEQRSKTTIHTP